MTRESCRMAALVEARHDGRLGEREVASIERHVATCESCSRLADELNLLATLAKRRAPARLPMEHQRGRTRLLREAASDTPRPPRRLWPRLALAIPAFAAVLVFLVLMKALPRPAVPMVSRFALPSWNLEAPRETAVHASEGTRFTRHVDAGVDALLLETGTLDITVRPLGAGERFLVRTSDAEVEVRGTRFRVEAEAARIRLVSVTEGKVEVRYLQTNSLIGPGGEWRPPATAIPAATASQSDRSAPGTDVLPRPPPHAAANPGGTPHPAPAAATSSLPEDASSSDFREALRVMERGDYGAAAERLDGFVKLHPDDVRAEDAAFLVIVSLDRAGRSAEAAGAARRYLARFPNGYRRAEAEAIANKK